MITPRTKVIKNKLTRFVFVYLKTIYIVLFL